VFEDKVQYGVNITNLLMAQCWNRVTKARETLFYVVTSFPFQCIVMCPLVSLQQQ